MNNLPCVRKLPIWLLAFAIILSGLAQGCAKKTKGSGPGPLYQQGQFVLPGGRPATEQELVRRAMQADYILIGERHTNPGDHVAQADFIELLAQEGVKPSVGLEMLPRRKYDTQLASFSQGRLSMDALPQSVGWHENWGYDFSLYQPVFEVVRRYSLPVYGLNIPNDVRAAVSRKGLEGLTATEKRQLPASIIPPTAEQRKRLAAVYRDHESMRKGGVAARTGRGRPASTRHPAIPGEVIPSGSRVIPGEAIPTRPVPGEATPVEIIPVGITPGYQDWADRNQPMAVTVPEDIPLTGSARQERFMLIQSLWDSTMAEQAVSIRSRSAGPVVILAGAGHVEYGYGIAHRLRTLSPGARILILMPFAGGQTDAKEADVFYYSTGRPRTGLGLGLVPREGQLHVKTVVPGSRAERAGFQPGDTLVSCEKNAIRTATDMHRAAAESRRQRKPMNFTVHRNGMEQTITVAQE